MEQVLYETIAYNIKKERKKQYISQAQLAERADISLDTIKSIETGRRSMSLGTYLRIVEALETTPVALMNKEQSDEYIDQLLFMVTNCSNRERKFVLHMVEQLIKGQERYLKD
jgi:transcriptional regulator with XRE-family HTH domain